MSLTATKPLGRRPWPSWLLPRRSREQLAFASTSERAEVGDFWQLMKPGVMSLVVFSALVGMLLAPGPFHPFLGFVSILAIALGSGAAAVFNMWYDRDIDCLMTRTAARPIPGKRVAPQDAFTFGILLTLLSLLLMLLSTNMAATSLLAFSIFFYAVVYTIFLKRLTAQNIVIGGVAGALPPLIGWVARADDFSFFPVLLFLLIFIWTPSHFWALALYRHGDYQKASLPMLPVTAGVATTKRHIFMYSLLLAALSLAPFFMGYLGGVYALSATVLGGVYLVKAARLFKPDAQKESMQLFGYSILYLFILFAVMVFDRLFTGAF